MSTDLKNLMQRFNDLTLVGCAEVINLGKYLCARKQEASHGKFYDEVNVLGLHKTQARLFMACARKFSGASPVLLEAIESAGKMIEMLRLDAQGIADLGQGKSVCGLNIFQIRFFGANEVKERLCAALGNWDAPKIQKLSVDEELLLRNYRKCTGDAPKLVVQMARLLANKC